MNLFFKSAAILTAILIAWPGGAAVPTGVSGTFIQLNRQVAGYSTAQWKALLASMQSAGMDTLIIQWTAEPPVLYFKNKDLAFKEQFATIERLMAAESGMHFAVFLGLQHDPAFWNGITARDKVLRDYFLVRQAQNERIQAALLKTFAQWQDWVGYYLPDEIDDISWRDAARRRLLGDYLRATIARLRQHDARRKIAVSAFFRTRTAPTVVAENLDALTADIGLDYLLLQDGAGNNDPPDDIRALYYQAMLKPRPGCVPERWVVLEAFRQTSRNTEPFAARPAPPDDFARQIRAATGFKRRILFSFPDYADPARGAAASALFQSLGGTTNAALRPPCESLSPGSKN